MNKLTYAEKEQLVSFIIRNTTYNTLDEAVFKHALQSIMPAWRFEQLIDVYQFNVKCDELYCDFINDLQ